MMITVDKSLFLSSGGERDVYIHPQDSSKVIKVLKSSSNILKLPENKSRRLNDNLLDDYYFRLIEGRVSNFSHITRCYGLIETDLGQGLVADRVANFDGSEITDMYDAVSAGLLTDSQEEKLIHELADYLTDNRIIFADAYLTNVLLQKTGQNSYRLVIIDGLGLRKRDIKSWLHLHVGIINRIRVKRQAERIISRYFMLKAEMADNKNKK